MQKKSTKKSEKTKSDKEMSEAEFVDAFNKELDEKEPDLISGLYGSKHHSLGVMNLLYSGLPNLDKVLAIKRDSNIYGIPLNKIIELYGTEMSGKTSLCLYLIACVIREHGLGYFVDFEHKYDPAWMRTIGSTAGVPVEMLEKRFRYVDPPHFEGFIKWLLQFMKRVIVARTNARKKIDELEAKAKRTAEQDRQLEYHRNTFKTPFIIVVDSIAAIYTKKEKEGEEESEKTVAEIARIFTQCLKHIRYYLGYTNTLIIFTNQVRDKIEMNAFLAKFGSKIKTPGGNAVKCFADGRIHIKRAESIKRTRNKIITVVGSYHNLSVQKNQMGVPPFKSTDIMLLHDRGPYSAYSVLETLAAIGKVKKDNSGYVFNFGGKVHRVEESEMDEFFDDNKKLLNQLHLVYKKSMGMESEAEKKIVRSRE